MKRTIKRGGVALLAALAATATVSADSSATRPISGAGSGATPPAAVTTVTRVAPTRANGTSAAPSSESTGHHVAPPRALSSSGASPGSVPNNTVPAPTQAALTCTVWRLPSHAEPPFTDPTVLGHSAAIANPVPMTPSTDLVKGTIALAGATLAMRIYVTDLDERFQSGADGISWRTTWSYAGNDYAAWVTYLQGGSESFSVATGASGQPYPLETPVSGSIVTGPGGYAEIDVPLSVAGGPSVGSVLTGVSGTSFADFGAGPAANEVEWNIDFGGGRSTYTVGGC